MNPAEQYRVELEACPERVRLYVMGLENGIETLARRLTLIRDSEVKFSRQAWDWEQRFNAVLGPEIEACRVDQDREHGGPAHDDTHTPADWCNFIRKFTGRAEYQSQFMDRDLSLRRYEENLIHVIGLAISAIQSSRRIHDQAHAGADPEMVQAVKDYLTTDGESA